MDTERQIEHLVKKPVEKKPKKEEKEKKEWKKSAGFWRFLLGGEILAGAALLALLFCVVAQKGIFADPDMGKLPVSLMAWGETESESEESAFFTESESETETETETELIFEPHSVDSTYPWNLIEYTEIEVNGTIMESITDRSPEEEITFGRGSEYTDVPGIVTFRGNNFRDNAALGFAEMTDYTLNGIWTKTTGGLTYNNASWSGSGWTGQPLMMKWPKEMKEHMNLYDWAKEDDDLVEVIYACMDGYVYFLDLKTGQETRDALYLGFTFKGSGALDPRGYPIMYLGAGYDSDRGRARAFVINLLDCSVMYTFGNEDPFSLRGVLSYFDSSPLVDARTDTLIYPGENGILYLIKLNTQYDETAGTLTVEPDPIIKWRYNGVRTSRESYWLGMEDSAAVYKGYLFVADNGGNLMCLDLNTLELVWVQDILDDSNSTPVLSVENGKLYLYISTSFHLGWRSSYSATVPVWKIDAATGEIVWQKDYECYTEDGVSGGVQSTIALGDHELSDYIYVTVSRTGDMYHGVLACLDKKTGEVVWEHKGYYAWSSPVCVYNSDGSGNVLYCTCDGNMYLIDGRTGEVRYVLSLSNGAIEASPAVYEQYAVVGTRACKIWGVELK